MHDTDVEPTESLQLKQLPSVEHTAAAVKTPTSPFWNWTAKDFLESGVGIAGSWPLALLIALLILRKEIRYLTQRMLKWSGFGVDIEFREGVQKLETSMLSATVPHADSAEVPDKTETVVSEGETDVRVTEKPADTKPNDIVDRIQRLLELSPRAVVIEAFAELEDRARTVGTALSISPPDLRNVIKKLVEQSKLPQFASRYVAELTALRDKAVHSIDETIAAEDALRYWKLAEQMGTDLIRILQDMQSKYRIVYKGGPDNGFIQAGKDAQALHFVLAARPIPGTSSLVVGEPEVGAGTKGIPQYWKDAHFRQGLDLNECIRIWKRAGMKVEDMWKTVTYVIESIDKDLIVMKYEESKDSPAATPLSQA